MQDTFFVHFFAVVLHDHNVQILLSYTFFGGNVVRVLVQIFFAVAHFHFALVADSISHFATAARKFSCCSSSLKKMSPLFFLSLALDQS